MNSMWKNRDGYAGRSLRAMTAPLALGLSPIVGCGDHGAESVVMGTPSECISHLFPASVYEEDWNPIGLSEATVRAMAGAYGFAYGQAASAREMGRQHPHLNRQLNLSLLQFEQRFSSAVEAIDSVLLGIGPEWIEHREAIRRQIDELAESQSVSVAEAEGFVRTIEERVAAQVDVGYIRTLLSHHPRYRSSPVSEMSDGFRTVYATDGTGKSAGVRLRVHVPTSWAGREGERPHIVRIFTSEAGRGLESFLIGVRPLEMPQGLELGRQETEEFLNDPRLGQELIGGTYLRELCSAGTTLDAWPARAIYMDGAMETPMGAVEQVSVAYVTVIDGNLVSLQGMVGELAGSGGSVMTRFRHFAPLFARMASTAVLENRWE